ncbi:MAG: hypothetical protein ACI3Y7_05875 [Candidatus Cryptobacteroides sp.]
MKKVIPFFISQAVTLFGSQIVAFALVWYITLQTGSGLWVALLSICSFVPQFLMLLSSLAVTAIGRDAVNRA